MADANTTLPLSYSNQEASIFYRLQRGKRKSCSTSHGWTVFNNVELDNDFQGGEEISVKRFKKKETDGVVSYFSRLRQGVRDDPKAVLKPYFVNVCQNHTLLLTERRPRSFRQWIKKPHLRIWKSGRLKQKRQLMSMGDDFCTVFRQIGDSLAAMLLKGSFHGNLLKGVLITNDHTVKLCNMIPPKPNSNTSIDEWIKKDVEDFKILVKKVFKHNPVPKKHQPPHALNLFYRLCDLALQSTGKKLRDTAYFVFKNALFFDSFRRVQLFFVLWDFVETDVSLFDKLMDFTKGPVNMIGWENALSKSIYSTLLDLYNYRNMCDLYETSYGVIYFHRNCLVHLADYMIKRCRRAAVVEMLLEAIPDFMPNYFFLVATKLRKNEQQFKCGLVKFLDDNKF